MKANEYKAWYRRNDPQTARRDIKEYNRPFGERYERPPEYSSRGDAYRHYPAMKDISAEQEAYQAGEDKKAQAKAEEARKKESLKKSRASKASRGLAQTIAGNAVAAVVGGVVLVTSYQAITEENLTPHSFQWNWSEDYQVATVALMDEKGNLITEVPAEIVITINDPTCTVEGSHTYVASVEYKDEVYSETHVEPIHPLGHDIVDVPDEHDPNKISKECTRCHEQFDGTIDVEEE